MKTAKIIGGGLTGCTLAYLLKNKGYNVTIYEKSGKIGGLCQESDLYGLIYNPYGPHIFHTSNEAVWKFITGFIRMRPYVHRVLTMSDGQFYYYPINQFTMERNGWTPNDIFEKFVRNYTKKMWNKELDELGDEVKSRIRINKGTEIDFFLDYYQGHPEPGGYDKLFRQLTKGIKVVYNRNITCQDKVEGDKVIVTSPLDEYFNNAYGKLEWRGIRTEIVLNHLESFQHSSIINYPELKFPYLRITEFKKMNGQQHPWSLIGIDYPDDKIKSYPVDILKNKQLASEYKNLARRKKVILAGRLGTYSYLNMDKAIEEAMIIAEKL